MQCSQIVDDCLDEVLFVPFWLEVVSHTLVTASYVGEELLGLHKVSNGFGKSRLSRVVEVGAVCVWPVHDQVLVEEHVIEH